MGPLRTRSRCATARGVLRAAVLGIAFMIVGPLPAQDAPPTVMAGTKLRVQFDSEVGTGISRVNDGVEVHLLKAAEAQGPEALSMGTVLSGRVLAVRKGDKRSKSYAMIRLGFGRVTLPDGRSFPIDASLAELGASEYVDSEGAASTVPPSKGEDAGTAAASAGIGAGIGAGVGAGIDALGILAEHIAQWDDFTLKKGRKAWLRLNTDFPKPVEASTEETWPREAVQPQQGASSPPADEYPTKLPPSPSPLSADSSSPAAVQHPVDLRGGSTIRIPIENVPAFSQPSS